MRSGLKAAMATALFAVLFLGAGTGPATAAGAWQSTGKLYATKSNCDLAAAALSLQAVAQGRNVEYTCFGTDIGSQHEIYWRTK
ncbi:hypothetical protein ABZ614_41725 [Streptomyces sp. NPDC013178]|uniref:hypothetical protein n=1 Tax=Streptomyces sp. NPDC013178 TaxID=3155118 RepID=UPI0033F436F3